MMNDGEREVELIDLTGLTGNLRVDFTISREADFDNKVYFYAVDDITGTVDGVEVSDADYLQTALDKIISSVFSTSDDNKESGTMDFVAGSLIAPLIIADDNLEAAQNGDITVYFAFGGAVGGDGFDRIRQIDNRTFSFEDLPNLGDGDFNDIVITIDNFSVSV